MNAPLSQPIQQAFSTPIKIFDGLFMADQHIAQDLEFFETNLVTHVINCAGQEVPNNKAVSDVSFLTFDWNENMIQNITEQKVVSVTVNFIEECRKESGCLMINYCNSESRPFCLLACYLMVRFKWSLFKTLEFLNSRKEDVELEPAFFDQLTNFAQKLQEKNLVRSKTWVITQNMSDEEVIITNTYLNSKNKFATPQSSQPLKKTNKNSISWNKDIVIEHSYCPNSIIQDKNEKEKSSERVERLIQKKVENQKERSGSTNSREKEKLKKEETINEKEALQNSYEHPSASANMNEMSVTKKWAELREMWVREKENHNAGNTYKGIQYYYTEVSQKAAIPKKDIQTQKINDRLQDKLNLLKKHEPKPQENGKQINKYAEQPISEINNTNTERVEPRSSELPVQNQDSRYLHNNWIIGNHQFSESNKNAKNKMSQNTNKSVIIVKPNHGSSSLDSRMNDRLRESSMFSSNINIKDTTNNAGSRSSLRKVPGSDRKEQNSSLNKENLGNTKFFRNETNEMITTKARCSSAKPQRRDNIGIASLTIGLNKNNSVKGKGKWKL